ncbi:von Willebrand factor type A domain-containing protein [Natranaerovirga pectinivora]|uniref:von Willebrand factor type A domain-containing protein n=1 Tax=Natranaerovirga pectinivora TaxID=682400 RepID=A0A4R3MMR7_9FIRM|nr:VWA domain-containing protein [Natranaerovirga pectinivora]TCT15555.1 von Willebrand factor type A domain-containing protein [Natranaerovirga pectinivora]
MNFLQFWPLTFLALIPIVIIMYLLKQKAEDYVYSSTFLWEEVYKNMEVNTPWEKLKKSLLLLIQLLIILLIIFILMNPYFHSRHTDAENILMVIDTSGSMNTSYNDSTRFLEAIESAKNLVNALKENTSVSIISVSNMAKIEISNTKDKDRIVRVLDNIEVTHLPSRIEDSFSVINSLTSQWEGYDILFFTDQDLRLNDGRVISFNNEVINLSVDYVSHRYRENNLYIMAQVTNWSKETLSTDVNLYGDGKLLDIQKIQLEPEEHKLVHFNNVNFTGNIIKAELNDSDDLVYDNIAYDIITSEYETNVLLATNRNIFIEKALFTLPNINIYKTNDINTIGRNEYDLYIIDGLELGSVPKGGNVLLINPQGNPFVSINGIRNGGLVTASDSSVTKFIDRMTFSVREIKAIDNKNWMNTFLTLNNANAGSYGEVNGQKVVILPFDLHDTDLVLKPEFPILIHNILDYLVEDGILTYYKFTAGDEVGLNPNTHGSQIEIETPSGNKEIVPLSFPMKPYTNAQKVGVYTAAQWVEDEKVEEYFVVNFPSYKESRVESIVIQDNFSRNNEITLGILDLRKYLIIALLIFVLIEWVVYIVESRK